VFIQNINYIVDKRHKEKLQNETSKYKNFKFEENKRIKMAAIYENAEDIYNTFITSLERKRNDKSLEKVFKTKVYNTISINSPAFEKLPYTQNSIFEDPLHYEMLKHESSVPLYEYNINFNYIGVDLKSQNYFNKYLAKEELAFFKQNKQISIIQDFKKHIFENKEIINSFYNYIPVKNKSQLINANINKMSKTDTNKIDSPNTRGANNNKKADIIKLYNEYIEKYITQHKIEFHINYASNIIQTVSFCDYCSKPNNIWDIRKGFSFSRTKKETRTKCKFCNSSFIPYFLIVEDGESNSKNHSFDAKTRKTEFNEIPTDLLTTKNTLDTTKKIKKVEYMSFEHLMNAYVENSVLAGDDLSKRKTQKLPYNLYYNIWLLVGEVLIRIEKNKTTVFTFFDYLKKLVPNMDYDNKSSNFTLAKLMKESEYKNFVEANEKRKQIELKRFSNMKKEDDKKKNVNVKFELKNLIVENKYKEFEKNLVELRKAKKEAKERMDYTFKTRKGYLARFNTQKVNNVSESYIEDDKKEKLLRARSKSTLILNTPNPIKRNSVLIKY
jgi:hypothetical protein